MNTTELYKIVAGLDERLVERADNALVPAAAHTESTPAATRTETAPTARRNVVRSINTKGACIAMKKVIVFASIIILTIAVVGLAVIGISHIINTNQNNLNEMLDILADTISKYSNNEIIELKGTYGKLNGNGNGIRYFGAALVDKNAIDNPDGLIAELDSKFEIVGILDQDNNSIDIKYLEHESLSYDSVLEQKKEYLTIFFYQSYYDGSNNLDPRGH